jgi:DNA-binding MarR family transcriptional regulator
MLLQMQVHSDISEPTAELDRLINDALPNRRGLAAWQALLRAHASVMRELSTDLALKARLPLGDFDVLAQLAFAGGELRMTDLAHRAFSSRSAMTRRVDRMVEEGLVRRTNSDADGRGVVVALTDAGLAALEAAVPIHLKGVSKLFVERLSDEELSVLERALGKIALDCSFG